MFPFPTDDMAPGLGAFPLAAAPEPVSEEAPALEEALSTIRELLRTLVEADGSVSEQERLKVEKIMTAVQELAAGREKEEQAALGGGPATNFIRRTVGGAV